MSIIESANGVGARLAEARSQQGLSVEDLSSRTYIRPAVIRGIENDDFTACGGPFYARGHIRTIARTLGLEETPLLQQFDRQHGAPEPRLGVETPAEPVALRSARSRPSRTGSNNGGPGWMAVATVVLIVICVVLLVSVIVGGPSDDGEDTTAAPPPPSPSAVAPSAAPSTAAPAPQPSTYTGVNLTVRLANGPSWVRVTDENGQVLASNVGTQGMQADFRGAQQLRFTFGNAAAAAATCNGKDLGPLGGQGQVVTRTLVLGDPACGPSTG